MNFSERVEIPLPSKFITLQFASLERVGAKNVQSRDNEPLHKPKYEIWILQLIQRPLHISYKSMEA